MQMGSKKTESWSSSHHIRQNRLKKITRNKEGHYIIIQGSIQEEEITIITIYATNIGAAQYIIQTLTDIKGKLTVTQ